MIIRAVTPADRSAIRELLASMPLIGAQLPQRLASNVAFLSKTGTVELLAQDRDGSPIDGIVYGTMGALRGDMEGNIVVALVREEARVWSASRRTELGRQLIEACTQELRRRGIHRVWDHDPIANFEIRSQLAPGGVPGTT